MYIYHWYLRRSPTGFTFLGNNTTYYKYLYNEYEFSTHREILRKNKNKQIPSTYRPLVRDATNIVVLIVVFYAVKGNTGHF